MTPDIRTALTAIDNAIGDRKCRRCGQPIGPSPSPDFCSEDCQQTWHEQQAETPQTVRGTAPAETTPALPLGWLWQPPGAVVRAGHQLLDDVMAFVARFSVFPSEHCAPTLALWYAHTHATEQFYVTPRLVLDSAEPGSGKTRVLEVAQYLVRAPEMTISATPAALFRLVSLGPITILFDEVDVIFNPKNGGNNEDLRGLLNAGYKRSATIARCVGDAKNMKVERFAVYAPAALAGIAGAMPSTITTRAITMHMRRRRADEPVEPFRERQVVREAQPLREQLAAWIDSTATQLGDARPDMPAGVTDRAAEIWEPLLAIADTAGGHWPDTARNACRHFVLDAGPQMTSIGVRLLADLREIFTRAGTDRMTTADVLTALGELEESPWADLHGKPLDSRRLSKELARYGIKPKNLRLPIGGVIKGYRTDGDDGLADVWSRYLPAAATSATAATAQVNHVADTDPLEAPAATAATRSACCVAAVADVADRGRPPDVPLTSDVAAVAAVADETGKA
ncbi:MAG: hypothetical protein DLM60_21030 [Pseudonocardiales bacterium]|nr:MAG: hypothetical protein DLM60_21030 [Pseudonocardiales bacterium]